MSDSHITDPLAQYLRDAADGIDRGDDPVLVMIDLGELIMKLLKIARIGVQE